MPNQWKTLGNDIAAFAKEAAEKFVEDAKDIGGQDIPADELNALFIWAQSQHPAAGAPPVPTKDMSADEILACEVYLRRQAEAFARIMAIEKQNVERAKALQAAALSAVGKIAGFALQALGNVAISSLQKELNR